MGTSIAELNRFYNSRVWRKLAHLKKQMARGVCEECGKTGQEVHHIIPLTLRNYLDPTIAMNLDNLQLLCHECHNSKRSDVEEVRHDVKFNEHGDLIKR